MKKILRGQQRETDGTVHRVPFALAVSGRVLHPGEGHEKGGVEGEVGYFRRNHWVPVPVAADLGGVEPEAAGGLPRR